MATSSGGDASWIVAIERRRLSTRNRPPRIPPNHFRSRRGDRIKVLYWDRDGLALWYKRLEKGSFRFPAATTTDGSKGVEVKAADLMMILDGVDLGSVRRQRRYERQPA